jgi:signal transduction histidine kinase
MKNWTKNFNYQSASTHYKLQEMILSQGDDSQLQPIKSIISMVDTLEGMLESMP